MACGPTRNLTSIFVKYRAEQKKKKHRFGYNIVGSDVPAQAPSRTLSPASHASANNQHLLSSHDLPPTPSAAGVRIEMSQMSSLPPLWVDIVEETQDDIVHIKEKLSALQKAQQRRLLKVFGDEQLHRPDKEIEKLSTQIGEYFRKCDGRVRQIMSQNLTGRGLGDEAGNDAEIKLRENAQSSIATQLQALSVQFRRQQKFYVSELKKRGDPLESQTMPTGDLRGDGTKQPMQGFSESLMMELETMEQEVDSRNEEIASIARSVADLHTIFKELSVLVIEQGSMLDRIDFNVEKVVDQTRQANVHIRKAEEYQKNSRATRVVIFLLVAIVVLILLFVWKHM